MNKNLSSIKVTLNKTSVRDMARDREWWRRMVVRDMARDREWWMRMVVRDMARDRKWWRRMVIDGEAVSTNGRKAS